MIQEIIVWLIFVVALAYIGKIVYRSFKPKNGICDKGCSGCGATDLKTLEKQIRQMTKDREEQHA